ncbi:hypothetical protein PHYSODRAFT_258807 [Phytophthora sojae]|uniref:HTH CENPB-type domain-containing protein n=1 Tax=Phytophthora sojae (strain P6497) TaxID=1094619 RepID=G4ZVV8_PHYSP|nr:hypothetical protein PHYSODRAFT_258807 [Phytophthora sojae]EGZ12294.1 hypothetical protein PHYSODRAFT_258807 [Phytophthora sojae]|eukprot:XP_009532627.1 hypothetical protein PHYSODRAFT_258807 [Phytophthora sojae]
MPRDRSPHQPLQSALAARAAYSRLAQESQRQPRASPYLPPVPYRASRLTLSGSGRKPDTALIEDTLCVFIKDEQRLEHTVTVDFIIDMATELMPEVMGPKSPDAKKSWCQRFLRRHHLTIRRICHSGRKTREELEALRLPFVEQVTEVATQHCPFLPYGPPNSAASAPAPKRSNHVDYTDIVEEVTV